MTRPSADEIKELLGLEPLGFEGGFYRETHRSEDRVPQDALPERYTGARSLGTAIFYMLVRESCSLMHRLKTDEIYHFYLGDPVEMLMLHPDGSSDVVRLGSDVVEGQRIQHLVPRGVWQGSRIVPGGEYALLSTTMSPGFELADFELGARDELVTTYPDRAELLTILTPARLKTTNLELAAATLDLLHAERRGVEALSAGLNARVPETWARVGRDESSLERGLERLSRGPEHRGWWAWYVIERESRDLIGIAGYRGPPSDDGLVEVVAPSMVPPGAEGFAVEAVGTLVQRAEEDARVRGVVVEVDERDPLSSSAMEDLGFVHVESPTPGRGRYRKSSV